MWYMAPGYHELETQQFPLLVVHGYQGMDQLCTALV